MDKLLQQRQQQWHNANILINLKLYWLLLNMDDMFGKIYFWVKTININEKLV